MVNSRSARTVIRDIRDEFEGVTGNKRSSSCYERECWQSVKMEEDQVVGLFFSSRIFNLVNRTYLYFINGHIDC